MVYEGIILERSEEMLTSTYAQSVGLPTAMRHRNAANACFPFPCCPTSFPKRVLTGNVDLLEFESWLCHASRGQSRALPRAERPLAYVCTSRLTFLSYKENDIKGRRSDCYLVPTFRLGCGNTRAADVFAFAMVGIEVSPWPSYNCFQGSVALWFG